MASEESDEPMVVEHAETNPEPRDKPSLKTRLVRFRRHLYKKDVFIILMLIFLVILILIPSVFLGVWYTTVASDDDDPETIPPPSKSVMGVFDRAAVVSAGLPCAVAGKDVLARGGSAVDAAITILLCDGICVFQSLGIGGGFVMTIYDKAEGKSHSLIAREVAPAAATWDMYKNRNSFPSALFSAVPGELRGYQAAHEKFGKLPWKELFQPAIALCEKGCPVDSSLAIGFQYHKERLRKSRTFNKTILSQIKGRMPKVGDLLRHPKLAKVLRAVAESPDKADAFYKGSIAKDFVKDVQTGGGIITEEDMNNYKVRWEEPYNTTLPGGLTVFAPALPGSGILITFMLKVISGFGKLFTSETQLPQVIVETFKHAYGLRTHLADPHFDDLNITKDVISKMQDDKFIRKIRSKISLSSTSQDPRFYGDISRGGRVSRRSHTSNIAVVAPDGSAVCVTSTINTLFSGAYISTSTGVLLNNQMYDFSYPTKSDKYGFEELRRRFPNYIMPGKRPLASLSPSIVVDEKGEVRLAVGTAGASLITTTTTLTAVRNLWLGRDIKQAIDEPRYHHNLVPMRITYEKGVPRRVVEKWVRVGHKTARYWYGSLAVTTGIARLDGRLTANVDWRKEGSVDGF